MKRKSHLSNIEPDCKSENNLAMKQKQKFIKQLAIYLCGNSAEKSIKLQMETKEGKEWRDLLNTTPIFGWKTVEEAEEILTDFLK